MYLSISLSVYLYRGVNLSGVINTTSHCVLVNCIHCRPMHQWITHTSRPF